MRRLTLLLAALAILAGLGLWVTRPKTLPESFVAGLTPDLAQGEMIFHAAGCASCHMADKAEGAAQLVLSGGQLFPSPFGGFRAPNISQDPEQGIGGWSDLDLANALIEGTSPEGQHYYPAFPYTSFTHMTGQQVVDLHGYLKTLPADATPSLPHEIPFPFTLRAGLGLWKMLFFTRDWVTPATTPEEERGRMLVEGLSHCGECHTPRNALGALDRRRWMAGAPDPSGKGKIPRVAGTDWSQADLVEYFTSGFTPEFDSAGGHMAHVVSNLAHLPEADRGAIAAYVKRLPAPAN